MIRRGAINRPRLRRVEPSTIIGIAILGCGILILWIGQVRRHGWTAGGLFDDMYANVGSELFGIALVILFVDSLSRRRETRRLKLQLIRELSSTDHGLTARAVLELDAQGWLYDGTLTKASLSGANLAGATLENADLNGVNLAGANLERTNLSKATLTDSNLSGANMRRANLEMADLNRCHLEDSTLQDADMARVRLNRANLAGACLIAADLSGADLSGADLRGADLTTARLTDTILAGIRHDGTTTWPASFVLNEVPQQPANP
ncbi:hypothetical protein BJ973_004023 [Actinoplanes tereljensis]|uniref:Pentapeptide repeat-containing protein n=1 Tax=Paractinoplanes tereljensis TaxID=571912 RepID=A0A919NVZ5_9ACTN|nr:pentapeptide repeat-containing protein [Actinoplanes tereljensis]GIF25748.1 hypothetical protein Ate02nite_84780 [Actinoplanes tereljensis]